MKKAKPIKFIVGDLVTLSRPFNESTSKLMGHIGIVTKVLSDSNAIWGGDKYKVTYIGNPSIVMGCGPMYLKLVEDDVLSG